MLSCGVANYERSANGTHYILTSTRDSRFKAGTVEVTTLKGNTLYSVRDAFDNPVSVGSTRYHEMIAAVKQYEEWAKRHS
jgi:hypothetical protein